MQLLESKDFDRQLKQLARKGGISDAVHKQVVGALAFWAHNLDPKLPKTHHGENRIRHVVKYDLKGHFRLVVYEHAEQRIPLMVGDHEEVEKWLNNNRGKDFTINRSSKRVQFTFTEPDATTTQAATADLRVAPTATGPVLAKLPTQLLQSLGLAENTLKASMPMQHSNQSRMKMSGPCSRV